MSSPAVSQPSFRDPSQGELVADAAVHAAALVAGVIGFSVLFQKIAMHGAFGDGLAMAVYAAGFFLLFGFSCAYNMAPPSPNAPCMAIFWNRTEKPMTPATSAAACTAPSATRSPWLVSRKVG